MKRALLNGVASLLLFALHAPAQAATTSFSSSISGTLFSVDPALSSFFSVGNLFNFSVTYTYDPALLTEFSSTLPTQTVYAGGSVVGGGTIFGSTTYGFSAFTAGTGATLSVNNDVVPTFGGGIVDSVVILGGYSGPVITGFTTAGGGFQLRLADLEELAISDLSVPDLAAYNLLVDARVLRLRFFDSTTGVERLLYGIETPLPPALLLFLTGLGVMGLVARRKKQKTATLAVAA